jgi:hypothetical protein
VAFERDMGDLKMKKLILLTLLVTLTSVFVSCTGPKGATGPAGPAGSAAPATTVIPANAVILLDDNFDDQALGVTPTTSAGSWTRIAAMNSFNIYTTVTNTAFVSYNKSFMIKGLNTSNYDRNIIKSPLTGSLPSITTGKINISFYVNKDTLRNKGFCFYINQLEKARIDLTADGKINVFTNINSFYTAGTYTTNIFVKYEIVINLDTQNYAVYTNDILIAENIPCYNAYEQATGGFPISQADAIYTTFFGIMTQIDSTYDIGTMYIDNVLIYYTPN